MPHWNKKPSTRKVSFMKQTSTYLGRSFTLEDIKAIAAYLRETDPELKPVGEFTYPPLNTPIYRKQLR